MADIHADRDASDFAHLIVGCDEHWRVFEDKFEAAAVDSVS